MPLGMVTDLCPMYRAHHTWASSWRISLDWPKTSMAVVPGIQSTVLLILQIRSYSTECVPGSRPLGMQQSWKIFEYISHSSGDIGGQSPIVLADRGIVRMLAWPSSGDPE